VGVFVGVQLQVLDNVLVGVKVAVPGVLVIVGVSVQVGVNVHQVPVHEGVWVGVRV
jgi:hypothetical protein